MNPMSVQPEITVLISTFNDRTHVTKKINELEAQTAFDRAEFLFIETDSPGRERELLEPYCEQHPNCRLITRDECLTLYEAWNLGWREARAPLLCISNMDDAMHPCLLDQVTQNMQQYNWDIATVLTAKQALNDPMRDSWMSARLKQLPLQPRPGSFFAWKRNLKEHFGLFDPNFEVAGDKDFWARAVCHKLRIGLIPQILYLHSRHLNQLSKENHFKALKEKDRRHASRKAYPHRWPQQLLRKIRRINKISALLQTQGRYIVPLPDD